MTLPGKQIKPPLLSPGALKTEGRMKTTMALILKSSTYSQPAYSLGGSIALISTLISNKYKTTDGIWANIYLIGIGPTGSGKDGPRNAIKHLAFELGIQENVIDNVASGPGLEDHLFNLDTPELLLLTDEFGKALQQRKQNRGNDHGIVAILLKLFTSVSSYYTKRSKAGDKLPPVIDNPFVSVYGTTTEEDLLRALSEEDAESGFLGRFLFFKSNNPRPISQTKSSNLEAVTALKNWHQLVTTQYYNHGQLIVWYSRKATDSLNLYQQKIDEELRSDTINPVTRSTLVRLVEMIKKIALISAVSRNPVQPTINIRDVDWAKAVCNLSRAYVISELTEALESGTALSIESQQISKCLNIIKRSRSYNSTEHRIALKQGYMPKRLLQKKMMLSPKIFNSIIQSLIDSGQIGSKSLTKSEHGITCQDAYYII